MNAVDQQQQQTVSEAVSDLRAYAEELSLLASASSLMAWDEKTKMPPKGAVSRARSRALLAGLIHERSTSDRLRSLIEAVEGQEDAAAEARVMRRDYDMSTKLPNEHVRAMAEATSLGHHAWQQARANDDFATFAPQLEQILQLARRTADYLGYEAEPYDALVDIYEEGMTAAELAPLFEQLRGPVHELLERVPAPDLSILRRSCPVDLQEPFFNAIVESMGFDFQAGRTDTTAHPFCIEIGPGDVRLTTRYDEHWMPGGLFATIHEAGHGIYNQSFARLNVPATLYGAPGLGMHESQSRMYENIVGRSREFWSHHYPSLQRQFPESFGDVSLDDFHRAINGAERSLIRVEADELTYNMHVALRFEIERQLVNCDLPVQDLPEAWRDGMNRWVGVVPTNDADGVLQDVHWSMGSFGYFPTYTLGNVYSAQFVQAARRDLPSLDEDIARGDISGLVSWFDEHVYRHGRAFTGRQFVERIAGGPIDAQPLIDYLRAKFGS